MTPGPLVRSAILPCNIDPSAYEMQILHVDIAAFLTYEMLIFTCCKYQYVKFAFHRHLGLFVTTVPSIYSHICIYLLINIYSQGGP